MLAIDIRSPQQLLVGDVLSPPLMPSLGITIAVRIVRQRKSRNPAKCLQKRARGKQDSDRDRRRR
jgi:hypothetical protein